MQHHNVVIEDTLSVKNCIFTDCIDEHTTGAGVTIEDVLIKDGKLPASSIPDPLIVNTIDERTVGTGVTVDGVLIKDGKLQSSAIPDPLLVNIIDERAAGVGVTVDGVLLKDGVLQTSAIPDPLLADNINERTLNADTTFGNDIVVNGTASASTPTANGHLATKLYVDSSKTLATVLTAGNATGGTDINLTSGSEIVSSEGPGIVLDATAGPITGSASSVISFIAANTATYNGTVCNFQATSGNMNLVASDSILLAPGTGNAQIDGNVLVNQNTVIDMGNDNFSPTLAQIRTGYLTQNNFTTTADHDLTLPTGTVLNGITNGVAAVGASFSMIVCNENNSSGFTRTVLGNTNVSFQGAGSIVYSGETGFFLITKVLASPLKWVIIRQDQGVSSTTGVVGAAFTANSGTAINTASTFGGYTVAQISSALSRVGSLF